MENRVAIKSHETEVSFEGICAIMFTAGLISLAGLFLLRPPIAQGQQSPATISNVVPKIPA
jgi:hypothetical protein